MFHLLNGVLPLEYFISKPEASEKQPFNRYYLNRYRKSEKKCKSQLAFLIQYSKRQTPLLSHFRDNISKAENVGFIAIENMKDNA